MPEGDKWAEVHLRIPATSVTSIRLVEEESGDDLVIALVFEERVADEIVRFLTHHSPWKVPDGVVIKAQLERVHPDMLESWIRGGDE